MSCTRTLATTAFATTGIAAIAAAIAAIRRGNPRSALRRLAAAACLLAAGCATQPPIETAPTTAIAPGAQFILVRHAQKASDDPKDPGLSEAGRASAQRLRMRLSAGKLEAVYATAYKRTQQTAAPVAAANGVQVINYDAAQSAADFAAQLRRTHVRAQRPMPVVLIVGHSNTVPAIAAALCGCPIEPMADDEFDRIIGITFDDDDIRTQQQRY